MIFFLTLQLLVTAYDSGAPETTTSETVTIYINRNLNAPQFGKVSYTATVYDYDPIGSSVVKVTATDQDITSPENSIIYDIDDNSGYFNIHPFNGMISINRQLSGDSNLRSTYLVSACFLKTTRTITCNPKQNLFVAFNRKKSFWCLNFTLLYI